MMMIKGQGVRTALRRLGRVRRLPVLLAYTARWSEAVRPPGTRRVNVERGRERILLLLLLLSNNTTPAEAGMTSQQARFLQLRRVVGESEARGRVPRDTTDGHLRRCHVHRRCHSVRMGNLRGRRKPRSSSKFNVAEVDVGSSLILMRCVSIEPIVITSEPV